jgi:ribosomal silencing factor RsfS
MRWVLLTCWVALLGVMILMVRQRYCLEKMRHDAEELAHAAEERAR